MRKIAALLLLLLTACGEAPKPPAAPSAPADDARCVRGQLEADLRTTAGGDSTALPPGRYVFSATYLRLSTAAPAQQKFRDLMKPMDDALQHAEGLVAYRVATSSGCVTARTLSVWKSEQEMRRFVVGAAHGKAIAGIGEVSRGGSVTTRWEGDAQDFSFDQAAQKLAKIPPLDLEPHGAHLTSTAP